MADDMLRHTHTTLLVMDMRSPANCPLLLHVLGDLVAAAARARSNRPMVFRGGTSLFKWQDLRCVFFVHLVSSGRSNLLLLHFWSHDTLPQ